MRIVTFLAATAFGFAGIQAASAADMGLPLKTPPPPAAVWTWTGFYIGANGGAGFGQVDPSLNWFSGAFTETLPSHGISGFLGGGQVGYNWQMPNAPVVLGIEGDFDWAGLNGTTSCPLGFIPMSCNTKENWIADVTGRVGFIADKALIYVKGGVAWAQNNYTATMPFDTFTASETKVGGLLGAGVEYAITPSWSAKIEYDFIDFGSSANNLTSANFGPIPPTFVNLGVSETVSEVKFGLNYRWNWAP